MDIKIDFKKTSPEYFLDKIEELKDEYRVEFQITEQWITELDPHNYHKDLKVGNIRTSPPEWPKNPPEAFELFKNFYAKQWQLIEVGGFLDTFKSWDKIAMTQRLQKLKKFIKEAKKSDQDRLFGDYQLTNDERSKLIYLKLRPETDYYNRNHIQYDYEAAKVVYGRYFLFKELLEQKLNVNTDIQSDRLINELKTDYSGTQLSSLFDGINESKERIDKERKSDYIKLFQDENLYGWKPIKWKGSNPELATLILKLTGKDPKPSLANRYFEPDCKYDSHSHSGKGNRTDNPKIAAIFNKIIGFDKFKK